MESESLLRAATAAFCRKPWHLADSLKWRGKVIYFLFQLKLVPEMEEENPRNLRAKENT